uniref:Uncharacterized protein n=1 Tax=Sphaerodactylus townsendi TaxID=933632 RepID=A0ACB8FEU9_9SAUR
MRVAAWEALGKMDLLQGKDILPLAKALMDDHPRVRDLARSLLDSVAGITDKFALKKEMRRLAQSSLKDIAETPQTPMKAPLPRLRVPDLAAESAGDALRALMEASQKLVNRVEKQLTANLFLMAERPLEESPPEQDPRAAPGRRRLESAAQAAEEGLLEEAAAEAHLEAQARWLGLFDSAAPEQQSVSTKPAGTIAIEAAKRQLAQRVPKVQSLLKERVSAETLNRELSSGSSSTTSASSASSSAWQEGQRERKVTKEKRQLLPPLPGAKVARAPPQEAPKLAKLPKWIQPILLQRRNTRTQLYSEMLKHQDFKKEHGAIPLPEPKQDGSISQEKASQAASPATPQVGPRGSLIDPNQEYSPDKSKWRSDLYKLLMLRIAPSVEGLSTEEDLLASARVALGGRAMSWELFTAIGQSILTAQDKVAPEPSQVKKYMAQLLKSSPWELWPEQARESKEMVVAVKMGREIRGGSESGSEGSTLEEIPAIKKEEAKAEGVKSVRAAVEKKAKAEIQGRRKKAATSVALRRKVAREEKTEAQDEGKEDTEEISEKDWEVVRRKEQRLIRGKERELATEKEWERAKEKEWERAKEKEQELAKEKEQEAVKQRQREKAERKERERAQRRVAGRRAERRRTGRLESMEELDQEDSEEQILADAAPSGASVGPLAVAQESSMGELKERILAEAEEIALAELREKALAEAQERELAEMREKALAKARKNMLAELREKALAEARQRVLAEMRESALTEAQARVLAEVMERALTEAQEMALAEGTEGELYEARVKELAEQRMRELYEERMRELADTWAKEVDKMRVAELAEARVVEEADARIREQPEASIREQPEAMIKEQPKTVIREQAEAGKREQVKATERELAEVKIAEQAEARVWELAGAWLKKLAKARTTTLAEAKMREMAMRGEGQRDDESKEPFSEEEEAEMWENITENEVKIFSEEEMEALMAALLEERASRGECGCLEHAVLLLDILTKPEALGGSDSKVFQRLFQVVSLLQIPSGLQYKELAKYLLQRADQVAKAGEEEDKRLAQETSPIYVKLRKAVEAHQLQHTDPREFAVRIQALMRVARLIMRARILKEQLERGFQQHEWWAKAEEEWLADEGRVSGKKARVDQRLKEAIQKWKAEQQRVECEKQEQQQKARHLRFRLQPVQLSEVKWGASGWGREEEQVEKEEEILERMEQPPSQLLPQRITWSLARWRHSAREAILRREEPPPGDKEHSPAIGQKMKRRLPKGSLYLPINLPQICRPKIRRRTKQHILRPLEKAVDWEMFSTLYQSLMMLREKEGGIMSPTWQERLDTLLDLFGLNNQLIRALVLQLMVGDGAPRKAFRGRYVSASQVKSNLGERILYQVVHRSTCVLPEPPTLHGVIPLSYQNNVHSFRLVGATDFGTLSLKWKTSFPKDQLLKLRLCVQVQQHPK